MEYTWEKFEDSKAVTRSRKSKDRQYNDQAKKYKRTNNDLQNTTKKTEDWATRTPLKPRVNSGAPEG
jgi:ribosomal protein L44E